MCECVGEKKHGVRSESFLARCPLLFLRTFTLCVKDLLSHAVAGDIGWIGTEGGAGVEVGYKVACKCAATVGRQKLLK